ncbi:hypothetical protein [Sphingobium sp.]|jgi:hypothetical protein|uniref:hypothetical protein n=1 Tax=Sphingobium sp. TaxID=1912891 RepID=UPI00257D688A|nr:hypothetical protein [Sphingobium sp.]
MSQPENPSAFPACNEANVNGTMGMTLRDWFAGQAIGAVIRQCAGDAAFGYPEGIESMEQLFAGKAFAIADAMLAERAKGGAL